VLAHGGLIVWAYLGAILLRFDFEIPSSFRERFWMTVPLLVALRTGVFTWYRLYEGLWRYVGMHDALKIFKAVTVSSLIFAASVLLLFGRQFPGSILILDWVLCLGLVGGARLMTRALRESRHGRGSGQEGERRVLIAGAGDAGEQIVRAILRENRSHYSPVGFVDDDPAKQGAEIHGVRVLGRLADIPELVKQYQVEELLITMPSAPAPVIRKVVELGRQAGLQQIRALPSLHELVSGRVRLADVREVQLEDLLGREPVRLDTSGIEGYLKGKVVLVTGAAGSIGKELCIQIARFRPRSIIALDHDESGLFYLSGEMHRRFPDPNLEVVIADIRERSKIDRIFQALRPQVVFHAASYKHVPLLEFHPDEAVKTNVLGTLNVAKAAQRWGAEKFVLISTDKAVNPTSVMGATKRLAEMVVRALNGRGKTSFIAVRLGNVLGSRGSVTTIFEEQIKRGGPVTVTHPGMKRYFMAASEAVLLTLQAGALGQGGEVFVLDMGEPIRIVNLARQMIRLAGYEPDIDIPIVYTGPRPGEKLFEDPLSAEEGTIATQHEKIFIAKLNAPLPPAVFWKQLRRLRLLARQGAQEAIIALLQEIVPTYKPDRAPSLSMPPAENHG